eukprot:TRINITY_DN6140_c0_g2_i1.p1 TRINITY_DN6140_c0_g2~~TRINITY_DN6140_c0_g2_i1.p1  ORF type:complete len:281 (+),score=21.88 TRINITY_DN6140_c0_g2_i1:44-844(+)
MLLLEHVNIEVTDAQVAQRFFELLGCVKAARGPESTLHMNCGAVTQFHLPVGEGQKWRGTVAIGYRNQADIEKKTEAVRSEGYDVAHDGCVTGPGGNLFKFMVSKGEMESKGTRTGSKTGEGYPHGIVQCTVEVPWGTSPKIARFYKNVFRFAVEEADARCCVKAGPHNCQNLTFFETDSPAPTNGEHFCFYTPDVLDTFRRCEALKLVEVNPRFVHVDSSLSEGDVASSHAFRTFSIVDLDTQEPILELEHEIRGNLHPSYPWTE